MDSFDAISRLIGIAAVAVGIYELVTKKLVGRDLSAATEEGIRKFLPFDVLTYVGVGLLILFTSSSQWIPFAGNMWVNIASMVLSFALIALNVSKSTRLLGKPKRNPHL